MMVSECKGCHQNVQCLVWEIMPNCLNLMYFIVFFDLGIIMLLAQQMGVVPWGVENFTTAREKNSVEQCRGRKVPSL